MKQIFSIVLCFLTVFTAAAQQSKPLQFREETHDFGVIDEHKGPVTHEFVFTNNASRPVTIINVQASCGCTTPGWTKEPVQPGQTGFVQARFDPRGRPGTFSKTLTVTTDLEGGPIILQIRGQVSGGEHEAVDETGFNVENGSLRLKSRSFNVGKVYLKDEYAVREFPVINKGSKPVTFTGKNSLPKHIRVEVEPATLQPNSRGTIKVSYNGSLRNQYGFQSDNIELSTDDELEPVKPFTVLATLEDYFPEMSEDELRKAPQLRLESTSLDFGRVASGRTLEREVAITNTGKKPLEIRAVLPNCNCTTATASKKTLKPGESGSIKVSFDPENRKGSHQKAVMVYTNDPRNPVQRFTFTVYID